MTTTLIIAALSAPALTTKAPSDLRDEPTDMVVRDLLGPAGGPNEDTLTVPVAVQKPVAKAFQCDFRMTFLRNL